MELEKSRWVLAYENQNDEATSEQYSFLKNEEGDIFFESKEAALHAAMHDADNVLLDDGSIGPGEYVWVMKLDSVLMLNTEWKEIVDGEG